MTEFYREDHPEYGDSAPGDERLDGSDGVAQGIAGYLFGLALAGGLTAASFYFAAGHFPVGAKRARGACRPGGRPNGCPSRVLPAHHDRGPRARTTCSRWPFGVLIVFLLIGGTLFIMSSLNHNMPSMNQIMSMQR